MPASQPLPHLDFSTPYSQARPLARSINSSPCPSPARPLRLALAGQTTTSLLAPMLRAFLRQEGIDCQLYEAPFSILFQEFLDPESELRRFAPEMAVLLPHHSCAGSPQEALATWQSVWAQAAALNITVIQGNYTMPLWEGYGHYNLKAADSRHRQLTRLNWDLADSAPAHVHCHDTESLSSALGRENFETPSFWYAAGLSPSPQGTVALAHSLTHLILGVLGKSKKVIALDLDNTLWGGLVGEGGPASLEIGGTPTGRAFADFQKALLELHDRGILLTVISKNDLDQALRPFRERPEMILREEHFACFSADWTPKPSRLLAMAQNLKLGVDSFVFVDDRPEERELMRQSVPQACVLELPADPALYTSCLMHSHLFETVKVTSEDRQRPQMYRAEQARRDLQAQAPDLSSYLRSLEMTLSVGTHEHLERVGQLLGKTNQFNLTGKRFNEQELLLAHQEQGPMRYLWGALQDKFGHQGLISVIVFEIQEQTLRILNWVMSCRVLKRDVEKGMFCALVKYAREHGVKRLSGQHVPQPRNAMTQELLSSLGFDSQGKYCLKAEPAEDREIPPEWLKMVYEEKCNE